MKMGETNLGQPIAILKGTLILFTLLLCAGCGATKSTSAQNAVSWAGTWSGQVDWVPSGASSSKPSAGDNVTITIAPYPAGNPIAACQTAGTCTIYQITGTDVGSILGKVNLVGQVTISNAAPTFLDYGANQVGGVQLAPYGDPYNTFTENVSNWQLNGNSFTITAIGTNAQDQSINLTLGTLTKQ
jgi:hypothetical protein